MHGAARDAKRLARPDVDRPAANQPEDAAHAVRIARERGLVVPYWEIGNEPDLYATVRGDPRWTAERYCAVFRAQAAAIRKEDPKARLAGPATSAAEPNATVFLKEFVTEGTPWAHVDIAGPSFNEGAAFGYTPKGGTGFGVGTLLALVEGYAA